MDEVTDTMLIARLIADPETLGDDLGAAMAAIEDEGWEVLGAGMDQTVEGVVELEIARGDGPVLDAFRVRQLLDQHFTQSDCLVSATPVGVPHVFVSDMDSTMIDAECIDELADFAGIKAQVAAITERAMRGEIDFAGALTERVALLRGLPASAIEQCLATRIRPIAGATTLVATLRALGCRTVLVTGGFHQFADPVAAQLGFDHVVANRLALDGEVLAGTVAGPIVDSTTKRAVLEAEVAAAGPGALSLATGDGANDIPMLEAASFGLAYRAKPRARLAADGWIDQGDLTSVLRLLGIDPARWVAPA